MTTGRLPFGDRLRTALTVLVIAHHTAITDGGSGGCCGPLASAVLLDLPATSAPARHALIHHTPPLPP